MLKRLQMNNKKRSHKVAGISLYMLSSGMNDRLPVKQFNKIQCPD